MVLAFGLLIESSSAGKRDHDDCDIWFVHATDAHLFLKRIQIDEGAKNPKKEQDQKTLTRALQEKLNRDALAKMLEHIDSLLTSEDRPAFLVFSGDLGIDPCEIPVPGKEQKKPTLEQCLKDHDPKARGIQIEQIAEVLRKSPVRDIYLVAGNNDIANESASDEALEYFNKFIDEVQAKLDPSKVKLHNLTRGYSSREASSTCYADIPQTSYRLIGFPSYSFKAKDNPDQERQMKVFRELVEDSRQAGKKALVISHTPGMDDPYSLALARYVNPTPTPGFSPVSTASPARAETPVATITPIARVTPSATRMPTETPATTAMRKTEAKTETDEKADSEQEDSSDALIWTVADTVLNDWKEVVGSESVTAVFAGHLHDSHKEIYERPYRWSSGSPAAFRKLFVAPPLAVKNQVTSPIQARGFSLVHLKSDQVMSRLFWYNSETGDFIPESKIKKHRPEERGFWDSFCQRLHAATRWLWELGDDRKSKTLGRMAMLSIALLATFLTVVAIWQIPPADNPLTGEPAKPKPAADPSPFSGNFAGIIIAGLGGLAATTVLKSFEGKPSAGDKEFYIVWFVISFFVLLVLSAFLRGLVEALRARFAIIYYPLPRPTEPSPPHPGPDDPDPPPKKYPRWPGKLWRWLAHRFFHAPLHWLSSLRVPLLTFADTFTNLIQGKNYTITQAFADKIVDQQRNVLRVANTICKQLYEVIIEKLRAAPDQGGSGENQDKLEVFSDDVRVNVSVLSLDQNRVFYISRAANSSREPFLKRSVAWVSVFTGKIRWYKESYIDDEDGFKKIILLDNKEKTIADDQPVIYLRSHYQPRIGADYEAWVLFPVPWPRQRGLEKSNYVKGAIHISFRSEEQFKRVWSFGFKPREVTERITKQIDDKIQAAKEPERQRLQQSRDKDIENAVKAENITCDPVADQHSYQFEERMLQDWCTSLAVSATLNTSIKVLGEVLRGFNEHIYNNIAKSEQPD